MPSVFISYRREEAADMSGRIADFLDRRFGAGTTFRDVNAILAGSNFVMALQRGLDESRVVLVLIGPRWIHMQEPNGVRRLDAGWSSRSLKRAGMRDVGEERGQLGRWGGGRPACPIELQPRPGAEPRPHPTQGRVPDDALPGGRCWS